MDTPNYLFHCKRRLSVLLSTIALAVLFGNFQILLLFACFQVVSCLKADINYSLRCMGIESLTVRLFIVYRNMGVFDFKTTLQAQLEESELENV